MKEKSKNYIYLAYNKQVYRRLHYRKSTSKLKHYLGNTGDSFLNIILRKLLLCPNLDKCFEEPLDQKIVRSPYFTLHTNFKLAKIVFQEDRCSLLTPWNLSLQFWVAPNPVTDVWRWNRWRGRSGRELCLSSGDLKYTKTNSLVTAD